MLDCWLSHVPAALTHVTPGSLKHCVVRARCPRFSTNRKFWDDKQAAVDAVKKAEANAADAAAAAQRLADFQQEQAKHRDSALAMLDSARAEHAAALSEQLAVSLRLLHSVVHALQDNGQPPPPPPLTTVASSAANPLVRTLR